MFILHYVIFGIPACVILSNKNRGCWSLYLLTFICPLIGFIVAICLKKKPKKINGATIDINEVDINNDKIKNN